MPRLRDQAVKERLEYAWTLNFSRPLTKELHDFITGFVQYGWQPDDYEPERSDVSS
jgi:hypothetical protein